MHLDSPEAVGRLAARVPLLLGGPLAPLSLSLPGLSPEENRALEARLNRLYDACGCESGAVASLGAIALYCVYVVRGGALPGTSVMATMLLGLAAFAVAGAIGKAVGIAHARWRLRRTLRELLRRPEVCSVPAASLPIEGGGALQSQSDAGAGS